MTPTATHAAPQLEEMRQTTRILLVPDAAPEVMPPSESELHKLTGMLRDYLEQMMPAIEQLASRYHEDHIPRYCAVVCVQEAGRKLRAEPGPGLSGAAAHARRLARVLNALCAHYELLHPSPAKEDNSDDDQN